MKVLLNRKNFLPAILMCMAAAGNPLDNDDTNVVNEDNTGGGSNLPPQDEAHVSRPKDCINWPVLGPQILNNIDWNLAEPREGKSGEFFTTTAHNVSVYKDGFRFQIGMSVNRMPDKRDAGGASLTQAEKRAATALGLTPEEALKIKTMKAQKPGVQQKIGDLK